MGLDIKHIVRGFEFGYQEDTYVWAWDQVEGWVNLGQHHRKHESYGVIFAGTQTMLGTADFQCFQDHRERRTLSGPHNLISTSNLLEFQPKYSISDIIYNASLLWPWGGTMIHSKPVGGHPCLPVLAYHDMKKNPML